MMWEKRKTLAVNSNATTGVIPSGDRYPAVKSGGGPPHKTLARILMAQEEREASWSAPVLWRSCLDRQFKSHPTATAGVVFFAAIFLFAGCATSRPKTATSHRPFDFAKDTLSFSNELSWEYFFDGNGKWNSRSREPPPQYQLHCFVVAHAAKQFFKYAEFHPDEPVADEKTYRRLIHEIVLGGDLRPDTLKIKIPGYASLHEFSQSQEKLLKEESGGAWRSYFQRGHWRMMLPFSRRHQERASEEFVRKLERNEPLVIHVVRFPQLSINHALLLIGFERTEKGVGFFVYDPNSPGKPTVLNYDRETRSFLLPSNPYFYGGKVNVYEVYRSCFY